MEVWLEDMVLMDIMVWISDFGTRSSMQYVSVLQEVNSQKNRLVPTSGQENKHF